MCLFARADVSAKWAMIWVIINVKVAYSGQVSQCSRVRQITLRKCVCNGPDAAFASKAMLQQYLVLQPKPTRELGNQLLSEPMR